MATHRMLPPPAVNQQTRIVNGRTYSASPGVAIDVFDSDALVLAANGWVKVAISGPTSGRPSATLGATPPYLAVAGLQFLDTTLDALITYDGAAWRNPLTGTAV